MVGLPTTTIVPFHNPTLLPSCAIGCGPLYDANGGCVPPAANVGQNPFAYTSCFCANTHVTAFSTAATGVCDTACPSDGLTSIATWFRSMCSANAKAANNGGNKPPNNNNLQSTTTGSSSSSTAIGKAQSSGGGTWLSNHWQWVIFLVILVVAIVGIWVGACIWRRRYLRKKDRQLSLGQKHSGSASRPSWGPGMGPGSEAPPNDNAPAGYDSQRNSHAMLTAATNAPTTLAEKSPKKKRWTVRDRT
ncbi:hypothetical protein BGZ63DRAFT_197506 [Mariannaea sp. PMI_226]|nr:hypothetical protein BGZ63DRAFT_197506 [Mariannaea sp. PMI_226]